MSSREERFHDLVVPAGDAVLAYLRRRIDGPADAADLLAQVFEVAWRRIDDVPEDEAAARAWLIGVARRLLANQRRGQVRREALSDRLANHLASLPPVPAPSAEAIAVMRALERMSPKDRELLTLVGWDRLSTNEIALVLSTSPSAIRQRLVRARQRFRRQLKREGISVPEREPHFSGALGVIRKP